VKPEALVEEQEQDEFRRGSGDNDLHHAARDDLLLLEFAADLIVDAGGQQARVPKIFVTAAAFETTRGRSDKYIGRGR
jgi:hypothetical protein